MKVSVKVPATTANIGPGFDCLGMALPIYNTITIEETVLPGTGVEINVLADNDSIDQLSLDHVPSDENSIVYKAVELLYNSIGQSPSELKINIHSNIPVARGLGSSSSVIVGALIAANELLGRPADEVALLSIACEIEGHPDNITPAIVGGLVISSQEEDGSVVYRKLEWPDDWAVTVCVPDFELSTDIARSVLPKEVPMKDAIFNAKRLAMFVQAVHTKDSELMKLALQDRLHQPYRMKLVPGLDKIIDNLRHFDNVLGCVLSGAGSSILVISERNDLDKIRTIVRDTWADQNIKCDIKTLSVENNGAQIISNED
ncbi:MAG: homoserine kinase [Candidatus Melainabacteria bacterium]|jgi:homoserine kinase|nr:MAG: homoserine kinase [Candidatus Melainabacteria bacterium]